LSLVERQANELAARTAVIDVLSAVISKHNELQIEFATKTGDLATFGTLATEHRDIRSAIQSVAALQQWIADLTSKSDTEMAQNLAKMNEMRSAVHETIRIVSAKEKSMKKDYANEMRNMEKAFSACQKNSEQVGPGMRILCW
jgi:hypothetical protein